MQASPPSRARAVRFPPTPARFPPQARCCCPHPPRALPPTSALLLPPPARFLRAHVKVVEDRERLVLVHTRPRRGSRDVGNDLSEGMAHGA